MKYYIQKSKILVRISLILCGVIVGINVLAQNKYNPGDTFKDCSDCPEMVAIPSGTFTMGSPESEIGRFEFEGPLKKITIKQFAAGKYDVTLAQWKAFVNATNRPIGAGCAFSGFTDTSRKDWDPNPNASWQNLGFPQDSTHPVVCITWNDAQDYVKWLSQKTGNTYRLLSEAEWEYAARAGTKTPYPWGSVPSHQMANYGADSGHFNGIAIGRDKWQKTSPVGAFPPNAFGLYDMQGNVLQYVEDCFSPVLSELPADGSAYKADVVLNITGRFSFFSGKKSCEFRIVRGGDWGDPPQMIRSGFRNFAPGPGFTIENYRSGAVSFRVAREL